MSFVIAKGACVCVSLEGLSSFVVNFANNIFWQAISHLDCNMCEVPAS